MKEKFLLSDEELSSVAGGLADEETIRAAFSTAAQSFEDLKSTCSPSSSTGLKLDWMIAECNRASADPMIGYAYKVDHFVDSLNKFYFHFAGAPESKIADDVRNIIDEIRKNAGRL